MTGRIPRLAVAGALVLPALSLLATRAGATDEMERQARKLGFPARNCLYCHASEHSVEEMKKKAKSLGMSDGNCLACHGANIPAKLNDRGRWLAAERVKRGAKQADMAWLRDYKEPPPPAAKPAPPAKP
jgi:hypothetical protein